MSIKKVANIAGVSIATVSRFFNNPNQLSSRTRDKVQAAIKQINYSPNALAQNLRRGKTGLIIAVVPHISSPVYETILAQLHTSAKNNGYNLLVKEAGLNSLPLAYYQQMVRCKQADGFILLAGLPAYDAADIQDLPIVLACEPPNNGYKEKLTCLSIDYYAAAKDATNYLIHLGHKHIAFIAGNASSLTTPPLEKGFVSAIEAADLDIHHRIAIHKTSTQSLIHTLQELLSTPPQPTALFCAEDDTALKALQWAKSRGIRVPTDLSIIGFNNSRYMELTDPPLTTISQPMTTIGAQAIEALCAIIDGKSANLPTTPPPHELIIRNSTTRAPL